MDLQFVNPQARPNQAGSSDGAQKCDQILGGNTDDDPALGLWEEELLKEQSSGVIVEGGWGHLPHPGHLCLHRGLGHASTAHPHHVIPSPHLSLGPSWEVRGHLTGCSWAAKRGFEGTVAMTAACLAVLGCCEHGEAVVTKCPALCILYTPPPTHTHASGHAHSHAGTLPARTLMRSH